MRTFGVSALRAPGAAVPLLASLALVSLAAGCSGGGGGGGSDADVGARDLYVVDMDLEGRDGVSLNTPMTIEFSEFVLPETIRHDTVQIRLGPRFGIQSFGEFKVSGNVVTFFPQLPTKADLSDSGFQPQSTYRVTVAGHPKVNRVKAYTGRPLIRSFTGSFATAASTSPDLFTTTTYKDFPPPKVVFTNPPDVLPVAPWTAPGGAVDVPTDASIQIVLNRVPLLPSTITTNNVSLTMIERLGQPQNRPIQGTPIVEQSFDGTSLKFVPSFPLADQARYVLRIENRVTDLTGAYDVADNDVAGASRTNLRTLAESGVDPALSAFALAHPEEVDPRTFLIFTTRDEPQKNLTTFVNFDGTDRDQDGGNGLDTKQTTASFNDAVPGAVAGVLTAAGGTGTLGVFNPSSNTTLSTNSPNAINGAFNYSQITIPTNVTVILTGTLPAQLLSLKSIDISGSIGASGSVGEQGETSSYSAAGYNPALARGGAAGPGGGAGADSNTNSSVTAPGFNGATAPNNGGGGGGGGTAISSPGQMILGGGGGGGGHQYAGTKGTDGNYPSYTSWGGKGGVAGPAGGIQPTSAAINDGKTFHTSGVGGGGGGSGENGSYTSGGWGNGAAAGGGGGGAVLVKSALDIVIKGSIVAKGGAGGNATQYYGGGGGGAGAGGSIVIFANRNLDVTNATLDTSGGPSSTAWQYSGGGGAGGGGFIQLEDADGVITGAAASTKILPDHYTGKFSPTGTAADAPSYFVSTWFNLGVFDPILEPFSPLDFDEQNFPGCTMTYEIQMAIEDSQNFGKADTSSISPTTGASNDLGRASNWVVFKHPTSGIQDVTPTLNGNGYQFYRLRIAFTVKDGQTRDDPVPYCERLRIRMRY